MSNQPAASDKAVTLFLSYARADEAQAKRLAAALDHAGYTILLDALIASGPAIAAGLGQAPREEGPPRAAGGRRGLLVGGSAAAVAAAGGGAWLAWDRGLFGGPEPLSIAVLPFRNLSGDRAQDYFADGL